MKNVPLKIFSLALILGGLSSCQINVVPTSSSKESSADSSDTSSQTTSQTSSESSGEEGPGDFVLAEAPYKVDEQDGRDFVSRKVADLEYGYFQNEPLIVYMDLNVALGQVQESVEVDSNEGVFSYACPSGVTYFVDPETDTITLHDWDYANLFSTRYGAALGLIDDRYSAERVDDSDSILHTADDVTLDLGSHHLDIVIYDERPFIPFSVIDQLVFNPVYYSSVAWNGSGFYLVDLASGAMSIYGYSRTSYGEEYYSGANRGKARPAYFAEWNKNAFLFNLDYFYGFRDERFVPFEQTLSESEEYAHLLDELESTDLSTYEQAVEQIINLVIGDCHTNAGNASSTFGTGSYSMLGVESERESQLGENFYAHYGAFRASGKHWNEVTYSGNTAILPFGSFVTSYVLVTNDNVDELAIDNQDTYALFLSAMKQIEAHGGIDNVIFDITCNGGGDSNALVQMLGVMGREYTTYQYNPLTHAASELIYHVDTNLDGEFDESDSYEGQYDFFILTSDYSFSCGNMFPYVAKDNGLATIIGQRSAGGACIVCYTVTPDGRPYRISGLSRTGAKSDYTQHDDLGVEVDEKCQIAQEHFYDDAYLDEFVNGLKA